MGVALSAETHGWGLLQQYDGPAWVAVAAGIVLLDLAIYLQHVTFHAVPALWRLHRMHHADLPLAIEPALRWLLVTPDMHRVHHSIERDETNSNFGFNLSLWDRFFGSYRAQPRAGHHSMTIGVPDCRDPAQCDTLTGMLAIPFHSERNRCPHAWSLIVRAAKLFRALLFALLSAGIVAALYSLRPPAP